MGLLSLPLYDFNTVAGTLITRSYRSCYTLYTILMPISSGEVFAVLKDYDKLTETSVTVIIFKEKVEDAAREIAE